jgi:hypothetical protein
LLLLAVLNWLIAMAEPENQTLRLLREIRDEFKGYRNEFKDFESRTSREFADIKEQIRGFAQILAGEMASHRYINGGVE